MTLYILPQTFLECTKTHLFATNISLKCPNIYIIGREHFSNCLKIFCLFPFRVCRCAVITSMMLIIGVGLVDNVHAFTRASPDLRYDPQGQQDLMTPPIMVSTLFLYCLWFRSLALLTLTTQVLVHFEPYHADLRYNPWDLMSFPIMVSTMFLYCDSEPDPLSSSGCATRVAVSSSPHIVLRLHGGI